MRRLVGFVLTGLALLAMVVGVTGAVGFGPDNRVATGPHRLHSTAPVIMTAPQAIAWGGPWVALTVTSVDPDRRLFVGTAHDVDLRDFLADTPRTVVEQISIPWHVVTSDVEGAGSPRGTPIGRDWWIASATGRGEATLRWTLPNGAADVVILDRDLRGNFAVELTAAVIIPGVFALSLGVTVAGLGVAVLGVALWRTARPRSTARGRARGRWVMVVPVLALAVSACAVPHRKDTTVVTKVGARPLTAAQVVANYNAGRASARGEPRLLAGIESGSQLAIDRGAYAAAAAAPRGRVPVLQLQSPKRVIAARFGQYPLWFAAVSVEVTDDTAAELGRVAVFERASSVSPWLMTLAPQVRAGASLPPVETDDTGAAVSVPEADATGVVMSPRVAVASYAVALSDPAARQNEFFADDRFRSMTHDFQRSQEAVPFASFRQRWSPAPVRYAFRVRGGGLLVFGDLRRTDAYRVAPDGFLEWTENPTAAAFLPAGVSRFARLNFRHQVLLYVPPAQGGRVRLLGQYGGVVGGHGR